MCCSLIVVGVQALSASGHLCLRQLLAGIGDGSGHVHMMYIMEPRSAALHTENESDSGIELQLRIPVVDV